jgi:hypothetical protein
LLPQGSGGSNLPLLKSLTLPGLHMHDFEAYEGVMAVEGT